MARKKAQPTREEKIEQLSTKAKDSWSTAKDNTREIVDLSGEVIKDHATLVDDKVRNDPWPIVGGAFVAGLLLGFILGSR